MARQVINAATSGQPVAAGYQMFEVQIFGAVDITQHVEAIYVAPSVTGKVWRHMQQFEADTGVRVERIARPREVVVNEGWLRMPTVPWNSVTGDTVVAESFQRQVTDSLQNGPPPPQPPQPTGDEEGDL